MNCIKGKATCLNINDNDNQWLSQPKNLGEQSVWFYANNTILFGKTPLKAQNEYIFQKFGGVMAPLPPPVYVYDDKLFERILRSEDMGC